MTSDASVLLFFIDGLGIGTRGPFNPLDNLDDAAPLAVFQNEEPESFFDGIVVPTDPTSRRGRPAAKRFGPNYDPHRRQCSRAARLSQAGISEQGAARNHPANTRSFASFATRGSNQ